MELRRARVAEAVVRRVGDNNTILTRTARMVTAKKIMAKESMVREEMEMVRAPGTERTEVTNPQHQWRVLALQLRQPLQLPQPLHQHQQQQPLQLRQTLQLPQTIQILQILQLRQTLQLQQILLHSLL
jgi:hypothetical protein